MNTIEKINVILKEANISKVNLAKYLGVSRQMVYNYLDGEDLSKFIRNSDWVMEKRGQYKSEQDFRKLLEKFSPVKISNAQTKRAGMSTSKTSTTTKIKSVSKTKKI